MLDLKYRWDHGRPDTDDLRWGRAVHCALFEGREFPNRYSAWEGRRAGKDYLKFADACWQNDKEILTTQQLATVIHASQQFPKKDGVRELIMAGRAEVTLLATENDVQCRGRVDWLATNLRRLVDLKTARAIDEPSFSNQFYDLHYDVKLGLYQRWLQKLTGESWGVTVIALEKTPPYDIIVYPIADAVLDYGADKGLEVIWKVRKCIDTGEWPGKDEGRDGELQTKPWHMPEADQELTGAMEVQHEPPDKRLEP